MSEGKVRFPSAKIRQQFLDFFAERGHTIVPSMSLVPGGDETLLFTNSGMVQFKDVFLGVGERPYTRVADSQKCMRVAGKHNDLDDVGRDDTHHTFFEMLGNWSFGDYYKEEAIRWAWELLTEVWELPRERFYATCFEDELDEIPRDDEAAEYWAGQPGFNPDHILFFGREENFWEMADTGPCGPDSEIHFDQGPEYCNFQHVDGHICQVNGVCDRYLELWNLVFIQYNRTSPTDLRPLPKKHVDTGMGFERIVSLLQGVESNYKTDLFTPLIQRIRELLDHPNTEEDWETHKTPYRVIADHARAATFLIGDGVVPGNVGRNYITRMIIRRASLFGSNLGFSEPFLANVAETVIHEYGHAYPEIQQNQTAILNTITEEERRFHRTVDLGIAHLENLLEEAAAQGANTLEGSFSSDLYTTYGLPLEITRDLAREKGFEVDEVGFREAMEEHRLRSHAEDQEEGEISEGERSERYRSLYRELLDSGALKPGGTVHDPYGGLEAEGPVAALVEEGLPLQTATLGDSIGVVLPMTHFYVEAGGQVSDTGTIVSVGDPKWEIRIEEVREPVEGLIVHFGEVVAGNPMVGDRALAAVDASRRWDIMRNHTATHLLHAGLREVIGSHARQAGSLVAPDRLRFDFTHSEPLTQEEIEQVESFVNEAILHNYPLTIQRQSREEAVNAGAVALFGESYGAEVRTVAIGDGERLSYELCGGTHVPETGVIGPFLITSEGSVAAGIRRIEAVTGRAAVERIRQRLKILERTAGLLGTVAESLPERVESIKEDRDSLERQVQNLRENLAMIRLEGISPRHVNGIPVLTAIVPEVGVDALRHLIDRLRAEHTSSVVVLATTTNGNPILVAGITPDLVERGLHAGKLVQTIAETIGGGGGGKASMAQAGGNDASKLPQALERVADWVKSNLE